MIVTYFLGGVVSVTDKEFQVYVVNKMLTFSSLKCADRINHEFKYYILQDLWDHVKHLTELFQNQLITIERLENVNVVCFLIILKLFFEVTVFHERFHKINWQLVESNLWNLYIYICIFPTKNGNDKKIRLQVPIISSSVNHASLGLN